MTPIKTTPKDFFLHLGATVALYSVVLALLNLAFSIINYAFPDKLAGYFYSGNIVWPISILIIVTPILYVLEWLIVKDFSVMVEKKDLWIRKWRIYLTLFLTGVTVIGDLIALINTYLNGEITMRFVFKILIVLLVAGAVFKYYFFSINENMKWAKMAMKANKWFGVIIVLASIVGGFVIVGSPAKQRDLRFDSQRVSDLSNIQWQVLNNWQQKGKLPATLSEMEDSISGYKIPVDPKTDNEYSYKVINSATSTATTTVSFELCADFALDTQDTKGRGDFGGGGGFGYSSRDVAYPSYGGFDDNWLHKAGPTCFVRTIDSEIYPVYTK
jgi:hypothetical protein